MQDQENTNYNDYVSLHNHTTFSILDSLIKPADLFKRAKELGQSAIAVTDHGTLAGMWDSLKESKSSGVKLIAGCEFYFVDDVNVSDARMRHVILLAKNEVGYRNLLSCSAEGYDNLIVLFKRVYPRIDWNILEKHSEGLICLTACSNGILGQLINQKKLEEAKDNAIKLKKIFGDDLGIELQAHALKRTNSSYSGEIDQQYTNDRLREIAIELDIKCVVSTDAHYVSAEQARSHDVLLAISSGSPVDSGNRLRYSGTNGLLNDFYIKSGDEVFAKLNRQFGRKDPDFAKKCIENTKYFADKCDFPNWIDPKFSNPSGKELPEFPVKDQKDYLEFKEWEKHNFIDGKKEDESYLRFRCEKGLVEKIPEDKRDEYRKRLEEEYNVLEFHKFSSYMLIVMDYLEWARNNNISTSPGRGSVGGSCVAYFLNIHGADPVKYGLIFARFLNKEKTAFPDIDCDFPTSGRQRVQDYVSNKYGKDHVAHVSNINTLTPKVYAKAIARAFIYGGDRKTAVKVGTAIADAIPNDIKKIDEAFNKAPLFAEYAKPIINNGGGYTELKEFAKDIGNKAVAWSTHAGGILIGKRPLRGLVPLRKDKDGNIAIEYEKERSELNGLIKMDILGLETLDIISETHRLITKSGKELPKNIDFDEYDQKTYDLVSSGNTFCVFQLGTSGGTIDLCKKIKPKCLEDISIINSLARPSARDMRGSFVETKDGIKDVQLLHPALQRSFGSTLGFGLYEESLMYLAQDVAGWDLHSADRLRKLTKEKGKNPEKAKKWKEEFITDSVSNGIEEEMATQIWEKVIEKFEGYGFNHSVTSDELIDVFLSDGSFIATKSIKNILPGEFVRSRDEQTGEDIFIEVLANHDHGEQEIVEVELESGEKVKCTMNHKFRVQETGEMLPLWQIINLEYSIVVG